MSHSNKSDKLACVHRFGDCVAASLGDGSTVYLTPVQAAEFAAALNRAAESVRAVDFAASSVGSFSLEVGNTGHNGTKYTHAR